MAEGQPGRCLRRPLASGGLLSLASADIPVCLRPPRPKALHYRLEKRVCKGGLTGRRQSYGIPHDLMRWLMIVLLVSLVALLITCAGGAYHVIREHRRRAAQAPAEKSDETETEDVP